MPTTSSTIRRYVRLTGLADSANLRNATLEGIDYTVVPVIALKGNVVIRPMGSLGPEFVPAHVLENSTVLWKNRPVVLGHPVVDGEPVSANDPDILESYRFGHAFTPTFDDGLKLDAWLNDDMATKVGDEAITSLEAIKAGEQQEVSIGAIVVVEESKGVTDDGDEYEYVWLEIYPDHLAILPSGAIGACNNEMGCGTNRTSQRNGNDIGRQLQFRAAENPTMNKFERKMQLWFRSALLNGENDENEWRQKLSAALYAIEPKFDWLLSHYQKQKVVVYETWDDGKIIAYQRSYKLDSEGTVTFKDDAIEVGFGPVPKNAESIVTPVVEPTGGNVMPEPVTPRPLVDQIISCANCKLFDESSRDVLLAMTDEQLQGLFDMANPEAVPTPEPVVAPVADDALPPGHVVVPAEQWAKVNKYAETQEKDQAAYRASLIADLAKVSDVYTEEFFKDDSLEKIQTIRAASGLARPQRIEGVVDYSVAHAERTTSTPARKKIPNPMALLMKKPAKSA